MAAYETQEAVEVDATQFTGTNGRTIAALFPSAARATVDETNRAMVRVGGNRPRNVYPGDWVVTAELEQVVVSDAVFVALFQEPA